MKKRLLLSALLASSIATMAQNVGIGTTTPTDQLHTTGTVRFQNYNGKGDRILMIDSAGKLKTGGFGTVFRSNAANSNLTIPDNGCTGGIDASSFISVSGVTATANTKIAIKVNITHTYVGDLALFLVAPGGATITLTSVTSSNSGDNFRNTIFTDGGAVFPGSSAAAAPFSGVYAPQGLGGSCGGFFYSNTSNFAAFTTLNGSWRLLVYDKAAGDVGTIDNWQITFDGEQTLQQEIKIAGNVLFQIPGAKKGAVLTAIDSSGLAEWALPRPQNTAFSAKLSSYYNLTAGPTTQVIPFTVPSSTSSFTSSLFDEASNFNATLNKYTIPADGIYQLNASLYTNGNYTASQFGLYIVRIIVNGQNVINKEFQVPQNATIPVSIDFSQILQLHKNDELSVGIFNNTGTTVVLNGNSCFFSGVRIN